MSEKNRVEVCLTPKMLRSPGEPGEKIVVVVDILRASTTICTALEYGLESIIPVTSEEAAREWKKKGFVVAAEREGIILDFADYGNSAFHFMNDKLKGKTLVYSTTNGTEAIAAASGEGSVVIGAFINRNALTEYLFIQDKDVLILCSGWKGEFCLEDTLFAGLLAVSLASSGSYTVKGDAALMAVDLWELARNDVMGYLSKADHRKRLQRLKLDDILEYSFGIDKVKAVPVLRDGRIVDANRN